VQILVNGDLFHSQATAYFDDIVYCVFMRCFLEVIPGNTPVTLDVSELIDGGYIEEQNLSSIFDSYMKLMLHRIELDYKIYGFVIEDDPSVGARLQNRIMELNEDQFIHHVLNPLLDKMGYEHIQKLNFHGPGEFGTDIMPFKYTTPLGTLEYYAVQAKATKIHGTSAKSGNAAELINQATQAFVVTFVDDLDNEQKRIDKFVIATNKPITASARKVIEDAMTGKRKLVFLDINRIVDLVKKHRLVQYVLFSNLQ